MAKGVGSQTKGIGVKKRTSIGYGRVGFSTMNKSKKASFKKYRGQGK